MTGFNEEFEAWFEVTPVVWNQDYTYNKASLQEAFLAGYRLATSGKMVDNPIIQEAVLWLRAVPSLESETYVAERKVWLACAPNDIELAKSIRTHIKQIGKLGVELHAMRASFALSQRGKNTTTTEEK